MEKGAGIFSNDRAEACDRRYANSSYLSSPGEHRAVGVRS